MGIWASTGTGATSVIGVSWMNDKWRATSVRATIVLVAVAVEELVTIHLDFGSSFSFLYQGTVGD